MTTSAYIHIPFCDEICNYCDFCKRFSNNSMVEKYLKALEKDIQENYRGEYLKTIYIGGGTPSSLSVDNLQKLMSIISIFNCDSEVEFTFECNPESITEEKLHLLKMNGVNRISIGVESTNNIFLKYLGRNHNFSLVKEKISLIKKYINNINVDLIYAIPNEKISDVINDLDNIMFLDVNHVSTYSLEIHSNTVLGIRKVKPIIEDVDSNMYSTIASYLKEHGFNHYEVSNFCKNNTYSRHNMVYWRNEEYYGFGLGASGYVDSIRYNNTCSMYKYAIGKRRLDEEKLNIEDKISYELILGFRIIDGINKEKFKEKYGVDLIEQYNIKDLIKEDLLIDDGVNIKIKYSNIYVQNRILENFV